VDATRTPWDKHYRMESYVSGELLEVAAAIAPLDLDAIAVTGHSMGGHGALTLGLKRPDLFRAISAFAPVASPMNCPWGVKALSAYIGEDRDQWRRYDACALIEDGARAEAGLLVDQGLADGFLEEQLKPELLEAACAKAGQALTLHRQPGYDHSYFFIASFIEDHLRWLSERL
ncbi:MAG: alpha/beta hydrolase-fold protein, partial [Oceanicaulis sp.]